MPLPVLCALALVLAIDVSGSITPDEYKLETEGAAQAFLEPDVQDAIKAQLPMAISVVQWGDGAYTSMEWRMLRTIGDVIQFSHDFAGQRRMNQGDTYMSKGISYSLDMFAKSPCEAERQVIDVSGDGKDSTDLAGPNNKYSDWRKTPDRKSGVVSPVVERAQKMSIVINGLPIVNPHEEIDADVVEYYQTVVHTPGGFTIQATGFADVARAMKKKLVMEISDLISHEQERKLF